MIISAINIPPYRIKSTTVFSLQDSDFPYLTIGKNSYITELTIESGLNFHFQDGCYNLGIGKYNSLAENILFMIDINHDYKSVYMGAIELFKDINPISTLRRKGEILILNDVWIGHGATIMDGVIIGNGAVVAAQSVVTKSVPDYAIVAGNPARIVGYRFDEGTRDKLSKIAWWNWSDELLLKNASFMSGESIDEFIRLHEDDFENELKAVRALPDPVSHFEKTPDYLYIIDSYMKYPVITHVIDEFCKTFTDGSAHLVFYCPSKAAEYFESVMDILSKYEDTDCKVQIIDGNQVSINAAIFNTDYYITNRSPENISFVDTARRFDKQIISGVSYPIAFK